MSRPAFSADVALMVHLNDERAVQGVPYACRMPSEPVPSRPQLSSVRSGAELRRWYWLKAELIELARARGVSSVGGKQELTARLAADLDGEPPPSALPAARAAGQLTGPLSTDTVIPDGQRASQLLRAFFTEAIGPSFRFDGPMREFIAEGAGRTLGDAVDHWYATRNRPRHEIAPQFEFNRFTRAWHQSHPDGTREQALAAWQAHRALPVDARLE